MEGQLFISHFHNPQRHYDEPILKIIVTIMHECARPSSATAAGMRSLAMVALTILCCFGKRVGREERQTQSVEQSDLAA